MDREILHRALADEGWLAPWIIGFAAAASLAYGLWRAWIWTANRRPA